MAVLSGPDKIIVLVVQFRGSKMSRQMLFCAIAAVLGFRSVSADASVSVALDFFGGDNPADGNFKEADSICKGAAIAELERKGFPVVPLDSKTHKTPAIRFIFSEVYVWGK